MNSWAPYPNMLNLAHLQFHLDHPLLRLQLFLDSKRDAAVVQSLVGVDRHSDLVAHP